MIKRLLHSPFQLFRPAAFGLFLLVLDSLSVDGSDITVLADLE